MPDVILRKKGAIKKKKNAFFLRKSVVSEGYYFFKDTELGGLSEGDYDLNFEAESESVNDSGPQEIGRRELFEEIAELSTQSDDFSRDSDGTLSDEYFENRSSEEAFEDSLLDNSFDDVAPYEMDIDFECANKKPSDINDPESSEILFSMVNVDGFDFDSDENDQDDFDVDYEGKKDRDSIATDMAVEVASRCNLRHEQCAPLEKAFRKSPYAQTAQAIVNGLMMGFSAGEIDTALWFRDWWLGHDEFKMKSYKRVARGDFSSGRKRRFVSWNQTFKILKAFGDNPSREEVEAFVGRKFDFWFSHRSLQREFSSFQGYLLAVCSTVRDCTWLIPNFTTEILDTDAERLCRDWHRVDNVEIQNLKRKLVRNDKP
ncbi:hypothetical protein LWC08_02270 [Desulfobaculum bizertense]|uniref:hypothetical protein n=1 Tax=Desulfobaculum bizertense TaxID=376490 RepID=UPI001F1F3CA8|nr:hypothetical protein [Desulfobaculum bizertense]UIJ38412.1 hypothetical protein LWC08_02270 [Desulfobaculum bizertense]